MGVIQPFLQCPCIGVVEWAHGLRPCAQKAAEWPPSQLCRLADTPPCRVQPSFEPAFTGSGPHREIRLGRSLSRHARHSGQLSKSVGSKRICCITNTAGYRFLYHKRISVGRDVCSILSIFNLSRIYPVYRARERDCLTNMVNTTNPGNGSFYA
jgi:hypothetical protein